MRSSRASSELSFGQASVTLVSVFLLSAPFAVLPLTVNSCSKADLSHRRSRFTWTCCCSALLTRSSYSQPGLECLHQFAIGVLDIFPAIL